MTKRLSLTVAALLGALLFALPVSAAELSPQAEREIAFLFAHMENSGCEFNRNGTWGDAAEASAHLRRKYRYLRQRELLSSADDFIVGAATASSVSGLPYQVRCPGAPIVESAPWFRAALEKHRLAHSKQAERKR